MAATLLARRFSAGLSGGHRRREPAVVGGIRAHAAGAFLGRDRVDDAQASRHFELDLHGAAARAVARKPKQSAGESAENLSAGFEPAVLPDLFSFI